ncbi:MAG: GtrA family protein [Rhodospirillales bacterium]|nr:GtrA family protein [Rhodospirillales bacterium]
MKKEVSSFLAVGVVNTIVSWAIYWTLLSFFGHQMSFAIAFVIATFGSWLMNSKKTFDVALSKIKLVRYFVFYIASYLFCRGVLYLSVDYAGINEYFAIVLVTAFGIPVNFIGSRWALKGNIRPTPL